MEQCHFGPFIISDHSSTNPYLDIEFTMKSEPHDIGTLFCKSRAAAYSFKIQ